MNDSLDSIRKLAFGQLSLKARLAYVALLLAATGMSVLIMSLWLTEPGLPARTQLVFGLMVGIGAAWIGLAAWVLTSRRPLFARDRVIGGRMAVAFTAVFAGTAGVAILMGGGAAALAAFVTGLVMLALAIGVLRAARRRFDALVSRRAELERTAR